MGSASQVDRLIEAGFSISAPFLLGVPICTEAGQKDSLRFIHKYKAGPYRRVATYYPADKIDTLRALGYSDAEAWEIGAAAILGDIPFKNADLTRWRYTHD